MLSPSVLKKTQSSSECGTLFIARRKHALANLFTRLQGQCHGVARVSHSAVYLKKWWKRPSAQRVFKNPDGAALQISSASWMAASLMGTARRRKGRQAL